MVLIRLLTFLLALLLAAGLIDQLLLPILTGKPLLWRFRRRGQLLRQMEQMQRELDDIRNEAKAGDLRKQIAALRKELGLTDDAATTASADTSKEKESNA